jgi:hypothetical protein
MLERSCSQAISWYDSTSPPEQRMAALQNTMETVIGLEALRWLIHLRERICSVIAYQWMDLELQARNVPL